MAATAEQTRLSRVNHALKAAGYQCGWSQKVRLTTFSVEGWVRVRDGHADVRIVQSFKDDESIEVFAPLGDRKNGSMAALLEAIR